jgi:hypothetical protein
LALIGKFKKIKYQFAGITSTLFPYTKAGLPCQENN